VKLRFLHAGDAADDVHAGGGGSRSRLPLVAGLVALLLGGGGAAFYFLRMQPGTLPVKPVAQPTDTNTQPPVEGTRPPPGGEPTQVANPTTGQTPEPPPTPAGPSLEERMALAQKAFDARDFDTAEDSALNAKDAQGQRPKAADDLLGRIRFERTVQKQLDEVRVALDAGRLDEAEASVKKSEGTESFVKERAELLAQLAEARKKVASAQPPTVPAAGTENDTTATTPQKPPDEVSPAAKALKDGREFLREKKYSRAVSSLQKCVEFEPENLDCHMFLGSALANTGKIDEGAVHYRRFLMLAPPAHPNYAKVKSLVEDYEKQKQKDP
jgi:hypothetical protein